MHKIIGPSVCNSIPLSISGFYTKRKASPRPVLTARNAERSVGTLRIWI